MVGPVGNLAGRYTSMVGKIVALIVLVLVAIVVFLVVSQYNRCKAGKGGILSQICHLLV